MTTELGDDVPQWSLHDIRCILVTGLQRLGIRFEVTEAVLNHVSGSKGGLPALQLGRRKADGVRRMGGRTAAHIGWHKS